MADDLEVTIARIEEYSKEATQGDWDADGTCVVRPAGQDYDTDEWIADTQLRKDARYIASLKPSVIQQMIEKLRTLEKERDAHKAMFWPPTNELEAHLYEIRNGKTLEYVLEHFSEAVKKTMEAQ